MSTPLQRDAKQVESGPSQRPQSLTGSRLRRHADYQRAYAASRKRQSASMSWFLAPQSQSDLPARVGITAGKVLGKAHERNRIKRRLREILRRHLDEFPGGCDLILHPRRSVLAVEFTKLEAEVVRILQQANAEADRMTHSNPAELANQGAEARVIRSSRIATPQASKIPQAAEVPRASKVLL